MSDTWVVEIADGDGDPDYYGPFETADDARTWCDERNIVDPWLLRIEPPEDYSADDAAAP